MGNGGHGSRGGEMVFRESGGIVEKECEESVKAKYERLLRGRRLL